jgi:signal peptidase II
MLINVICILAIVGLDQLVKYGAVTDLSTMATYPLWPNVFHLTYTENRGVSFSLFNGHVPVITVVTAVMLVVLLWLLYKYGKVDRSFRISLIYIIGGALGNLIDRVCRGFVVDMFDFRLINFAIFNVADCFIVIGVIMLMIYIFFFDRTIFPKEEKKH